MPLWYLQTLHMTDLRILARVKGLEQELLTLLQHMSSLRLFNGVCIAHFLFVCIVFCRLFVCHF